MNGPTRRFARWILAACLAFPAAAGAQSAPTPIAASPTVAHPPLLPRAVASFGAATAGGALYVCGGHVGRAHAHSRANLSASFWRLDLADGRTWQQLPDGAALQGTSLVALPDGTLLRIGGLEARNEPGDDEDLHSVASVDQFDPRVGQWRCWSPLPEPRSSHDAVVVDGVVYVIGGWHLDGGEQGSWHRTAWACDSSSAAPCWRALPPPPFVRRACAVARCGHRVAVVGGMDEAGTTSALWTFEPTTGQWSPGPDLPGPGFGTAAIGVDDALFATAMDGRLFRTSADADSWDRVASLGMPRFFHRLVAASGGDHLLALGGASRAGHLRHIELVPLRANTPELLHEWTVAFPGHATYRAALTLQRDVLHIFGGNRGSSEDRFAPDQFVDEAFALRLADLSIVALPDLPRPRQSMVAATWGERPHEKLLVGGIGPDRDDGAVAASADAVTFARDGRARELAAALPAAATQLGAVVHAGEVWLFGGTDFRPDAGGGEATCSRAVLALDPTAAAPTFRDTGVELPARRRSFGLARLDGKVCLIGGLGDGFEPVRQGDVFEFATRTWSRMPEPPRAWVSPQTAVLGNTVYVACGGTMSGRRFTSDQAVWAFDESNGWRAIAELPFATRHVQMLALRDRLLFVDMTTPGALTLRTWRPAGA